MELVASFPGLISLFRDALVPRVVAYRAAQYFSRAVMGLSEIAGTLFRPRGM